MPCCESGNRTFVHGRNIRVAADPDKICKVRIQRSYLSLKNKAVVFFQRQFRFADRQTGNRNIFFPCFLKLSLNFLAVFLISLYGVGIVINIQVNASAGLQKDSSGLFCCFLFLRCHRNIYGSRFRCNGLNGESIAVIQIHCLLIVSAGRAVFADEPSVFIGFIALLTVVQRINQGVPAIYIQINRTFNHNFFGKEMRPPNLVGIFQSKIAIVVQIGQGIFNKSFFVIYGFSNVKEIESIFN